MTQFRPSRFEILPVVIKNLLIINALMFLAQQVFANSNLIRLEDWLALHHVKSPLFKPWQIITHMFLHGDGWHIFGNMFALWMFGSILENLWGPKRFIIFYFLCGVGAALLHLVFLWFDYQGILNLYLNISQNPTPEKVYAYIREYGRFTDEEGIAAIQQYLSMPDTAESAQRAVNVVAEITNKLISRPTLGASGAVFGILAAFVYLFPNTYIYLYFFVPIKAKWLGLMYFGYELWNAIQNSAGDDIARWAHVGGAVVGFLLVLTWNKKNRRHFY